MTDAQNFLVLTAAVVGVLIVFSTLAAVALMKDVRACRRELGRAPGRCIAPANKRKHK